MNEDMNCIVKAQDVDGSESESYLDELFQTIQDHVLTLPEEEIETVLARLQARQTALEAEARRVRSQPVTETVLSETVLSRCQALEQLARRFYSVRYAVYRLLQKRHPYYQEY
jgi:phosphoribosyl-ATP pyrophosphohydrolase